MVYYTTTGTPLFLILARARPSILASCNNATIGLEWYALALWLWTFCMKAPSTYFLFHARAVFLVLSHRGVTYFQWSKVLSTTIWGSTQ